MILIIFSIICAWSSLTNCSNIIAAHYWELGCKPTILKDQVPQLQRSYDCSALDDVNNDQCFWGGKQHPVGSKLTRSQLDGCTPECECVNNATVGADWHCQSSNCDGLSDTDYPYCDISDVTVLYNPGNMCCKKQYICDKKKKIAEKLVGTCEYNGTVYMHGEKMPLPYELCVDCICVEGFDAKNLSGPGCQPKYCSNPLDYSSIFKKGCVPILYDLGMCCPGITSWRCPDDKDVNMLESTASPEEKEKNKDLKCKFGKRELKYGQRITQSVKGDECTVCSCTTPPHVTCVHDFACSSKYGHPIDQGGLIGTEVPSSKL